MNPLIGVGVLAMVDNVSVVIPVISAAMLLLVLIRPEITGLAVAPGDVLQAGIQVTTAEGVILPSTSLVEVNVGGEVSSMPIGAFISKSGEPYEIADGEVPEIGYIGPGYTGNYTYTVPISEFGLGRKVQPGRHVLGVKIIYDGVVISRSEREIVV